ncbi:MAG TPA: 2-aminoethylphosphonate ABC transporter permease subunit [Pseudonocardia sp.]|jgi:2-aminoethylphosphonate transport system permease protein|uniref:2-aminoethylphosphonate ABC transporter permease subunit n=1 Tax=Pseudonocardia sp. TaxID=60912 RepID=UPI002C6A9B6A|nr:2-aminoethylphosphonate ABC transporter permease subunit [Pseudonocardia sp.]HTF53437.1 2-aminoethylphosphonate ABC transporter permease subunit [Pseudonocardia sp.]
MTTLTAPAPPQPPAPGAERGPLRIPAAAWVVPPLLLILGFVGWPMVTVLGESVRDQNGALSLSSWSTVLTSGEFRNALLRTAQIAVGSTIGALILGSFLALVLAFVPFPGAGLVARLIDTVLALPSFLITLAFTFLYGSAGVLQAVITSVAGPGATLPPILTSPLGVILAEITFFTPFVVRPLLAALSVLPREQLEVAASLGAGPLRVLRTVVFPEVLPALAAGGSLVLLLTLNEFGIVLFTGAKDVTTLPVLIYTRGVVSLDLPSAAVVATAQVVLSLALYSAYRFGFGRLSSRDATPEPQEGAGNAALVAHQ